MDKKQNLKEIIAWIFASASLTSAIWGVIVLMGEPIVPIYRYVEIGDRWYNLGGIIQIIFLLYFYFVAIPITVAFSPYKALKVMVIAGPLMVIGFCLFAYIFVSCTGGV